MFLLVCVCVCVSERETLQLSKGDFYVLTHREKTGWVNPLSRIFPKHLSSYFSVVKAGYKNRVLPDSKVCVTGLYH